MGQAHNCLMINKVCPKEGGDAWVHDYWKSCKESDSFGKCFWGIYNKVKRGKI